MSEFARFVDSVLDRRNVSRGMVYSARLTVLFAVLTVVQAVRIVVLLVR